MKGLKFALFLALGMGFFATRLVSQQVAAPHSSVALYDEAKLSRPAYKVWRTCGAGPGLGLGGSSAILQHLSDGHRKGRFRGCQKTVRSHRFLYPGVTWLTHSPYPLKIVDTPGRVAILYKYMRTLRVIPSDGREHSKDPNPSFFGESLGKWEGDVLVVAVIGFNDRFWLDAAGNPHTDALHLIECYRLADALHLAYEVAIDDPKTYTKPWKCTTVFTRRPDWELIEYSCD